MHLREGPNHCGACNAGYQGPPVGTRCEAIAGTCNDGTLYAQAARRVNNQCETCHAGFDLQYTVTGGLRWCSGSNDNVGDVWGTGIHGGVDAHCPKVPRGTATRVSANHPTMDTAPVGGSCQNGLTLLQCEIYCAGLDDCTGFWAYNNGRWSDG